MVNNISHKNSLTVIQKNCAFEGEEQFKKNTLYVFHVPSNMT